MSFSGSKSKGSENKVFMTKIADTEETKLELRYSTTAGKQLRMDTCDSNVAVKDSATLRLSSLDKRHRSSLGGAL